MLLLVVEMKFDFMLMFYEISAVGFQFHNIFLVFWVQSPNAFLRLYHNRRLRRNHAVILRNDSLHIKVHSLILAFLKLEFLFTIFDLLFVFDHVFQFHGHENFDGSLDVLDQNHNSHILITHDFFLFLLHVLRPVNIDVSTMFPYFH